MQNNPQSKIPTWLSLAIIGVFCFHYTVILVFHFSEQILPVKYYYAANAYMGPWFHQRLTVFAPEPPFDRYAFVYRTKEVGKDWGTWKDPARPYLERQWNNRFDVAAKMNDMLELVGNNLYWTTLDPTGNETYKTDKAFDLPAHWSARKVIELECPTIDAADSFQVAVYVQKYRVHEDSIVERDSAIFYPKFKWR